MPIKLYLQKEVENWIWPVGQALVTGPFPFGQTQALECVGPATGSEALQF